MTDADTRELHPFICKSDGSTCLGTLFGKFGDAFVPRPLERTQVT